MSTLSTYSTILSRKIGTSSNNYFSLEARIQAINDACREFTDRYKPKELRKKANVTIAVDADDYYTGTVPSDLSTPNNVVKFWEKSSEREFIYMDPEQFYRYGTDIWTIDYSVTAAGQKIFVGATDVTTLEMHYYKSPTVMASDADDSGLNSKSDELIALMAAQKLFSDAQDKDNLKRVTEMIALIVPSWHNQYGLTGRRLKSKFERVSFHNRG